jgi:hypothetical protein
MSYFRQGVSSRGRNYNGVGPKSQVDVVVPFALAIFEKIG